MRGDGDSDCFRKSLWKAVLRSCKDLSAFLLRLKIGDIFFEKQCCAVAWTKGIHPASEKISKKQCCAVAPTYSAFLLRLKIRHIFFLSTVALLHGDWDLVCYKKSFWKAVLRSCKDLSAFLLRLNFEDIFFQSSVALLHGIKVFILLQRKFLKSSVAQLHQPTQLFC